MKWFTANKCWLKMAYYQNLLIKEFTFNICKYYGLLSTVVDIFSSLFGGEIELRGDCLTVKTKKNYHHFIHLIFMSLKGCLII